MESINISDPNSCFHKDGDPALLCARLGAAVIDCEFAIAKRRKLLGVSNRDDERDELGATIAMLKDDIDFGIRSMSENYGQSEPCPNVKLRKCSLAMAMIFQQQIKR